MRTACYHLPGLFEFSELYRIFLPLFFSQREWFYDWCGIGSVYGAPADCLWNGGRVGFGEDDGTILRVLREYGVPARLSFSNSLLREEHLSDPKCNALCRRLSEYPRSGVIVHSELLTRYLQKTYPKLQLISSTTKVLTDFSDFSRELDRDEFSCVVPDFRLNKAFSRLAALSQKQKDKTEFLCNECCFVGCTERKACYETVSRRNLGEDCPEHRCCAPDAAEGYRFSAAMRNPSFIGVEDILRTYLPLGFSNFKLEGRGLGSAVVLEFLLYYLTKPEYHVHVRERIYLDSTLDLF